VAGGGGGNPLKSQGRFPPPPSTKKIYVARAQGGGGGGVGRAPRGFFQGGFWGRAVRGGFSQPQTRRRQGKPDKKGAPVMGTRGFPRAGAGRAGTTAEGSGRPDIWGRPGAGCFHKTQPPTGFPRFKTGGFHPWCLGGGPTGPRWLPPGELPTRSGWKKLKIRANSQEIQAGGSDVRWKGPGGRAGACGNFGGQGRGGTFQGGGGGGCRGNQLLGPPWVSLGRGFGAVEPFLNLGQGGKPVHHAGGGGGGPPCGIENKRGGTRNAPGPGPAGKGLFPAGEGFSFGPEVRGVRTGGRPPAGARGWAKPSRKGAVFGYGRSLRPGQDMPVGEEKGAPGGEQPTVGLGGGSTEVGLGVHWGGRAPWVFS